MYFLLYTYDYMATMGKCSLRTACRSSSRSVCNFSKLEVKVVQNQTIYNMCTDLEDIDMCTDLLQMCYKTCTRIICA